ALNLRHRGRNRPTDVLAFALDEGPAFPHGLQRWLGDIVIAIPTAARQARRARREPLAEGTVPLDPGLLHPLGCSHRSRAEERRMSARTDALVAAGLGLGRHG